jgi:SHS family sialic acid transporter-like MFS transporter
MPLGRALAVLTFGLTLVVILLVGGNVPQRLGRLADRQAPDDHLVPEPGGAGTLSAAAAPGPAAGDAAPDAP